MNEKDKLNKSDNYLNFSRSKLKSIPKEIIDKKDSLESLDISGNNFTDFYSVLNTLKKFKKLKRLRINIFSGKQAKTIIDSLPNLEYLNDEPISDDTNIKQEKNRNDIQEKIDIKKNQHPLIKIIDINYKPVFKKLSEFFKLNTNKKQQFHRIIELFNKKCKELNIKHNKIIDEKMNDNEIKKELELYDLLKNELNIIKEDININVYQSNSVDKLLNIILENEKIKKKCFKILNERKKEENKSLNNSQLNKNKKSPKSIFNKKNNIQVNKSKSKSKRKEKKSLSKNDLKKNQLNRSFNLNNDIKLKIPNSSSDHFYNRIVVTERKTHEESKFSYKKKIYLKKIDLSEFYDDPDFLNLFVKSKSEFDNLNIFDDKNKDIILKEKIVPRLLNLNNLLEIINQIYKIRYNRIEKQKQQKQVVYKKRTLEQDFYIYLKSKYGLQNIIIEWCINIISSIQAYYKTNGEVYLFTLILRNELDEDSIEILNKIKQTMNSILNIIYDYNINKIESIKQNKEFISENEWINISNFLYNDDNFLKEKFIKEISKYINKLMKGKNLIEKTGKKILYEDFLNILVMFNINLRRLYLHNLFVLFSKEDIKKNGIIKPENYKRIIKNSGIIKDEQKIEEVSEQLIEIADKEGSGQIAFNDLVQSLDSLDLITEEGKIKFLEKLSNMNF